jgi:biopolymer transport protein ExbD
MGMKLGAKKTGAPDKVEQQMTPMIDIVFQLLAFFVMTFKVASPEGDFNISMPSAAPQAAAPDDLNLPPLKIALKADSGGILQAIIVNPGTADAKNFGTDMRALAQWVISYVGTDRGPNSLAKTVEVELMCDYQLHYGHTMAAVTAVSGYIAPGSDVPVSLFEKVKFSRQTKRPT